VFTEGRVRGTVRACCQQKRFRKFFLKFRKKSIQVDQDGEVPELGTPRPETLVDKAKEAIAKSQEHNSQEHNNENDNINKTHEANSDELAQNIINEEDESEDDSKIEGEVDKILASDELTNFTQPLPGTTIAEHKSLISLAVNGILNFKISEATPLKLHVHYESIFMLRVRCISGTCEFIHVPFECILLI
jgi:hypothetical protein